MSSLAMEISLHEIFLHRVSVVLIYAIQTSKKNTGYTSLCYLIILRHKPSEQLRPFSTREPNSCNVHT